MTLLRTQLGSTLRGHRLRQRRTLRDVSGAARRTGIGRRRSQQAYQLFGGSADVVVHDDHVELPGGVELGLGQRQPAGLDLRVLGAPAGEPADQL